TVAKVEHMVAVCDAFIQDRFCTCLNRIPIGKQHSWIQIPLQHFGNAHGTCLRNECAPNQPDDIHRQLIPKRKQMSVVNAEQYERDILYYQSRENTVHDRENECPVIFST